MEGQEKKVSNANSESLSSEKLKKLRSEEFFNDQKEVQLELIRSQDSLLEAHTIFSRRNQELEKIKKAISDMTGAKMDTLPRYDKNTIRHPLAISDPREIIEPLDHDMKEYEDKHRENVARAIKAVSDFSAKWELDYNPYFTREIIPDANELWHGLQRAYYARCYELQMGFEKDGGDFRDT